MTPGMDVVCAGMIVADVLARPLTGWPEPGGMTPVEEISLQIGGCAANTSVALHRLGTSVRLVGCIGDDGMGDFLVRSLRACGLPVDGVSRLPQTGTATTIVLIDGRGERTFIHHEGANRYLGPTYILPWLAGTKIVHLGGYFLLPGLMGTPAAELLSAAKRRGVVTSVDAVWNPDSGWMGVLRPALPFLDFFFANEDEAAALTEEQDAFKMARKLHDLGPRVVVIKRGERGCVLFADTMSQAFPALPVHVVDTTGAGDAFCAGFLAAYLRGWSLPEACRLANTSARLCITSVGATTGVKDFEATVRSMLT